MCGFAGIIHHDQSVEATTLSEITARMALTIEHRGPDSTGTIESPTCHARFQRLAIIDLRSGDQPLANASGSIQVFFNGEIYNHQSLRTDLESRGHRLDSLSDGAVLPYLYEELGVEMARSLNGMYGILVVDHRREEATLMRDHLGVKPLYFASGPGGVTLFASELKAIIASGMIVREPDLDSLASSMTFLSTPGRATPIKGVKRVLPGECITFSRAGSTHRLMPLLEEASIISPESAESAAAHFESALDNAMRRQVRADVPVGIALSGGIDSLLLAVTAAAVPDVELKAVTADFGDAAHSTEMDVARSAVRTLDLDHVVIGAHIDELFDSIPSLVWYLDEPILDPAYLSAFAVSSAAKQEVGVLLSGVGGDEILGGYGHFRLPKRWRYASRLPDWLSRRWTRTHHEPEEQDLLPLVRTAVRDWEVSRSSASILARAANPSSSRGPIESLAYGVAARNAEREVPFLDPVNTQLYVELRTYLEGQTLPMFDRATMAVSLEGRVPLLDIELVRMLFRLPGEQKLSSSGESKLLARDLIHRRLGSHAAQLPKIGFANPLTRLTSHIVFTRSMHTILNDQESVVRRLIPESMLARLQLPVSRADELLAYSVFILATWERLFLRDHTNARPSMTTGELFEVA